MSDINVPPEQRLASLFDGLARRERMALLAKLEYAGASLYRAFAEEEKNAKAREALLKACEREENNGSLLRKMTTGKDRCEKCAADLRSAADGCSCSFQCTFCDNCAGGFGFVCPNCGGPLEKSNRS
jgi:uncharacterized protein